ncbi:META domain-containing protein [Jatrophihabitans sp. YIM 134969]
MTIDDRLTRAGEHFRATHPEPAPVHLTAPADARQPGRRPHHRRRFVGIALAAAVVVALTVGVVAWLGSTRPDHAPRPAATTPAAPVDPLVALTTGVWRLASVETGSGPALQPEVRYTLVVAPGPGGDVLRLDDSCNATNVPVDIEPDNIRPTGPDSTTLVDCSRPDDPAAAAAGSLLAAPVTWSIDGADLHLRRGPTTATFTEVPGSAPSATGLERTSWQLVTVVDGGAPVPASATRSTELRFGYGGPNQVQVWDGCNTLSGGYAVDTGTLTWNGMHTTDVLCTDASALQSAVDAVFQDGATTVERADDRLTLTRGDVVLVYDLVGAD